MKKWEGIVDRLITECIGDGDVSHLPGAGKKLPLKDDSGTPEELRAAFKIMEDHDVAPEWIAAGARLEQMESTLRNQIEMRARQHLRDARKARAEAASTRAPKVEANWNYYKEQFLERVEGYNREVLVYNLTLPSGIPHRQTLRGEPLIEQALRQERAN